MSNEFPVNVFVSRSYPPPQTQAVTVTVSESVDALVDSSGAAEILGITTNNLRQMIHKGRLTVVSKRGQRNLFSRSDVVAIKKARDR